MLNSKLKKIILQETRLLKSRLQNKSIHRDAMLNEAISGDPDDSWHTVILRHIMHAKQGDPEAIAWLEEHAPEALDIVGDGIDIADPRLGMSAEVIDGPIMPN